MLSYLEWKRKLEVEDIAIVGRPVKRSINSMLQLYDIYKSYEPERLILLGKQAQMIQVEDKV